MTDTKGFVETPQHEKLALLSGPGAYRPTPPSVEVIETHLAWVFLAGERAYKLKKPVRREYLDFSTPAMRRAGAEAEVRLNRRLAPGVYLGVRPLRRTDDGSLSLGESGQPVDWLVEMRRLPASREMPAMIAAGKLGADDIARVAERLVAFYRALPPANVTPEAHVARFSTEQGISERVLADPELGLAADEAAAVQAAWKDSFPTAQPLLTARVRSGRIVEGHGDMRPEHVFLTEPPVVIDCLDFSAELRLVDPFDEIVFLGMECARLGADWVWPALHAELARGLGDWPPPALLAFYWRYRAFLRARLTLVHLADPAVRTPEKWLPLTRRYLALATEAEIRTRLR
jgi:uncharacterized protein